MVDHTNCCLYASGVGLAPLAGVRCGASSTYLARSNIPCPYFSLIQLAKEIGFFYQIGRIKALDPWTDLTSRCHLGYIYTDPQMTVKAYPHTEVEVVRVERWQGRIITAWMIIRQQMVYVICVYGPQTGRTVAEKEAFREEVERLAGLSDDQTMLCVAGDSNAHIVTSVWLSQGTKKA